MEEIPKEIKKELLDAIPVDEEKTKEYMEKVQEHIATAVENDEVNNEEMQKGDILQNLEYADGKVRDEVDLIEEQERIYGTNVVSPYKTADVRVFKRRLESMSRDQMTAMAEKVAARQYSSEEDQKTELMQSFYSWLSRNGSFRTSASKQAEKGALSSAFESSQNIEELEKKLKSKTLSDLQSTAARLGFNPSFERQRIIDIIKKEYQKQS